MLFYFVVGYFVKMSVWVQCELKFYFEVDVGVVKYVDWIIGFVGDFDGFFDVFYVLGGFVEKYDLVGLGGFVGWDIGMFIYVVQNIGLCIVVVCMVG